MKKQLPKPTSTVVLVTLVFLLVVAAIAYSAYEYQNKRMPAPTISTVQALKERDDAIRITHLHDAVNKVNLSKATQQANDAQAKIVAVCNQLKTLKQSNVACQ